MPVEAEPSNLYITCGAWGLNLFMLRPPQHDTYEIIRSFRSKSIKEKFKMFFTIAKEPGVSLTRFQDREQEATSS